MSKRSSGCIVRTSTLPLATVREAPSDAEAISHRLMLRAGLIRPAAAGVYSWLPMGMRVLHKVMQIVREEMDATGAHEMLMPVLNPSELWKESGRWEEYGDDLMRLQDRHQREFCLGPTHEEIITDIARRELDSYRQLPFNLYQIQTKIRDERRPRFGVMRGREFIMKDAYSFHADEQSLEKTYAAVHQAYSNIFDRLGLEYSSVRADSGNIGGAVSHEFQVSAQSGEDIVVHSSAGNYSANLEFASAQEPQPRPKPGAELQEVETPGQVTIEQVSKFLKKPIQRNVKTLLYQGNDPQHPVVALVLRGDHEVNEFKAARAIPDLAKPLQMVEPETVLQTIGANPGSIGPVGLEIPVYADRDAAALADFICGANRDGVHHTGVNWGRDAAEPVVVDIRSVLDGDVAPDGEGGLRFQRGIEVGHIFQLGDKYSQSMNFSIQGPDGKPLHPLMGCYGLGVTRVVAAAIEQHHDEQGICWPEVMAPVNIALILLNPKGESSLDETAQRLADQLAEAGYEVLLDDRDERPGVKFSDMELIGIPHRLVVSGRGMQQGTVEYRHRSADSTEDWPLDQVLEKLAN